MKKNMYRPLILLSLLLTLLLIACSPAKEEDSEAPETSEQSETKADSSDELASEQSETADPAGQIEPSEDQGQGPQLKDGTYEKSAWSFGTTKPLTLKVSIRDNRIESLEVIDSSDTEIILNTAIENLIPSIIEHQSFRVDSTSGATYSSTAIKQATEEALTQALEEAGSPLEQLEAFKTVPEKKTNEKEIETDVLVVGLGGSGMAAATRVTEELYEAYGQDPTKVNVLGIDKAAKYGGTSVTTSSPMTINPSSFVEANGGQHNVYGMIQNDGKMIQAAIDKGAATYNIGMPPVSHIGGAYKIMHEYPVEVVQEASEQMPAVTRSLNDIPMMMAVAPNSLAVNREGVRFTDETTLQAYGNWQSGAYYYTIWSDEQIQRIKNEGLQFDTIGIFVNQGGWPAKQPIPEIEDILAKGIEMDYIYKADNLEELAKTLELDPATLTKTVEDYNLYCDSRENPADGIVKSDTIYDLSGRPLEGDYDTFEKVKGDGPYYAVKGSPWIYSTTAALDINESFEVLNKNGEAIPGLYAVGTDSLGVLFTEKKEYVTYGGADQGWAFTSGYLVGGQIAEKIISENSAK